MSLSGPSQQLTESNLLEQLAHLKHSLCHCYVGHKGRQNGVSHWSKEFFAFRFYHVLLRTVIPSHFFLFFFLERGGRQNLSSLLSISWKIEKRIWFTFRVNYSREIVMELGICQSKTIKAIRQQGEQRSGFLRRCLSCWFFSLVKISSEKSLAKLVWTTYATIYYGTLCASFAFSRHGSLN